MCTWFRNAPAILDSIITDQDVTKLKETFVTKDDLKEVLKSYATQDSLDSLATKVDGIQDQLGDLKVEVAELSEKVDSGFHSLESKFDGMLGLLNASMEEHDAGAVHLARHDRQIGVLATATGVSLPD